MKDLDNLAAIGALGVIAVLPFFENLNASGEHLVTVIASGLIGYLAKGLTTHRQS